MLHSLLPLSISFWPYSIIIAYSALLSLYYS